MSNSSKEIVGMVAFQCAGANPEKQLDHPVSVTVDVSTGGERRVSCPFLQGISYQKDGRTRVVWFCTAGSKIPMNNFLKNLPPETPETENLQSVSENFAQCVHKNPA